MCEIIDGDLPGLGTMTTLQVLNNIDEAMRIIKEHRPSFVYSYDFEQFVRKNTIITRMNDYTEYSFGSLVRKIY